MNLTKNIWNRSGSDSISSGLYSVLISFFIMIELAIVSVISFLTLGLELNLLIIIGSLVASIIGILIFQFSDNPIISAIGTFILVASFGLILGPTVALYSAEIVIKAVMLTLVISISMSVAALGAWFSGNPMFAKLASTLGGFLFAGIIFLLIVRILEGFLLGFGVIQSSFAIIDYFAALLFSLYIWYDWYRGMQLPKTLDNAIDVSAGIFLDIINLFLNLLRIFGRDD